MTPEQLELKRLAEAATPGPWHWDGDAVKNDPFDRIRYQVTATGKTISKIYYTSYEGGPTNAIYDAKFIAAANPSAILELLRKLEEAQAENERLRGLLRESRHTHEMWKDIAPAVSLCADIDAELERNRNDH